MGNVSQQRDGPIEPIEGFSVGLYRDVKVSVRSDLKDEPRAAKDGEAESLRIPEHFEIG